MNPGLDGRELREAFDSKEYQVMIVANKFLTGFDQPKLCAMYVDKTLSGVEGVQTLSRLNRTYKKGGTEKDMTFILDFMNKAEDIKAAFDPFYKATVLSDNSDPNDIFAIKNRLIDFRIFTLAEVEEFATVYYEEQAKVLNKRQKEISQEKISSLCSRAANDYRSRHKNVSERIRAAQEQVSQAKQSGNEVFLKEATQLFNSAKDSLKELESFKSDVTHYIEFYDFMCNIVDYESEELEKLYIYLKHLKEYLKSIVSDDKVILTGLSLSHYKIHNRRQHQIQLNESKLTPDKPGGGSAPDKRKEFISKIIQALNDMFEGEFSGEEAKNFGETVMPNVMKNADVQTQIQAGNTEEQIMMGDYPKVFSEAVMGTINTHKNLAASLLGDDKKMAEFARLMLKVFISDTDKGAA
jgi:type I restriction enzyme R subunit